MREYARLKQIFRPPVPDPNERFPWDDETWYYLDQLARATVEWGYATQGVPLPENRRRAVFSDCASAHHV